MLIKNRKHIVVPIIVTGLIAIILAQGVIPSTFGRADFRAYWSTSRLLSQGISCSDDVTLLSIQSQQTGWKQNTNMRIWNPPWVVTWFLPLAFLNFVTATRIWLFVNILFLFLAISLGYKVYGSYLGQTRILGLAFLLAILFPSTIVAILMGQTSLMVLASLIGFLWFFEQKQDFLAGTVLAFATVKPHIIILVLCALLLFSLSKRRWRVLFGFTASLLVSSIILIAFRPTFILECLRSSAESSLFLWDTPTLPTALAKYFGEKWLRFSGLILVPIGLLLWWRHREDIALSELVNLTILGSLLIAPFAWSYDFAILLLPMIQILVWLSSSERRQAEIVAISSIAILSYIIYYFQRIRTPSEFYFFWVPLLVGSVYLYLWPSYRKRWTDKVCLNLPPRSGNLRNQ